MKTLLLILVITLGLSAQTTINGSRSILGGWDASGATRTAPVKVGTLAAIPSTCTAGDFYFASDGVPSRKLYSCTVTDTWVPIGYRNGASDPAACTVSELFVNTASTPVLKLCTATNTWTAVGGGSGSDIGTIITFSTAGSGLAANTAVYGIPGSSAVGAERFWYSPTACTLTDLYVAVNTALTASSSRTVTATIRTNHGGSMADTTLTCQINDTSAPVALQTCSDTNAGHGAAVSKGDRISIKYISDAATASYFPGASVLCK